MSELMQTCPPIKIRIQNGLKWLGVPVRLGERIGLVVRVLNEPGRVVLVCRDAETFERFEADADDVDIIRERG
jgi:hypothetical protein